MAVYMWGARLRGELQSNEVKLHHEEQKSINKRLK